MFARIHFGLLLLMTVALCGCGSSNLSASGRDCAQLGLDQYESPYCNRAFGPKRYFLPNGELAVGSIEQAFVDAKSGRADGHGLLLALIADEGDKAIAADYLSKFSKSAASRNSQNQLVLASGEASFQTYRARLISTVSELAGGPVSDQVLAQFVFMNDALGPNPIPGDIGKVRQSLVEVDIARARKNDSYAQTRLGQRYLHGDGVERSETDGVLLLLAATKTTGSLRQCVYAGGQTNCYDKNTLRPGNPAAQTILCESYRRNVALEPQLKRKVEKRCSGAL